MGSTSITTTTYGMKSGCKSIFYSLKSRFAYFLTGPYSWICEASPGRSDRATCARPSIGRSAAANAILDHLGELSRPFGIKSEHEDGTAVIRAA